MEEKKSDPTDEAPDGSVFQVRQSVEFIGGDRVIQYVGPGFGTKEEAAQFAQQRLGMHKAVMEEGVFCTVKTPGLVSGGRGSVLSYEAQAGMKEYLIAEFGVSRVAYGVVAILPATRLVRPQGKIVLP